MRERVYSTALSTKEISNELFLLLKRKKKRISVAESCTGGLLSDALVCVPGISEVFPGGFVTYSDEMKADVLSVSRKTLQSHTAVSPEVSRQMALLTKQKANVDIALSTTGYAGPDGGTKDRPVGTVYISCAFNDIVVTRSFLFEGEREAIRRKAVRNALLLAIDALSGDFD
ncbi:MAG: CinA family protein [Lachnospiraceae bacterium]|nr:CinA family protein [Lachnospiraceae bacterium]